MSAGRSIAIILSVCSCLVGATSQTSNANNYADPATWLCRPDRVDACTTDLSTTVIDSSGTFTREPWTADPRASIDCFYVYPTVSPESTLNSDMTAGPAEINAARQQFARFGSRCRVFAPLYRQVTIAGLSALLTPGSATSPADAARARAIAYDDVHDAWQYYLAHDNHGRGVVLIGHSQGSGILAQLIRTDIDGTPLQSRLVSAILPGQNIVVPKGRDIGGTFLHIPLCRQPRQLGCVITFDSFGATAPPPPNPMFGHVTDPGMEVACTNPAALAGGEGTLQPYFSTDRHTVIGAGTRASWVTPARTVATPWVSVPGLLTARCASNANASGYLEISLRRRANDARTGNIGGELRVAGRALPGWGLHLVDVNLAMGNLLDIVGQQSAAYGALHGH